MEKIFNQHFNETIYSEVLSNGLRVFILHRPSFNTTNCLFAVPYGSKHNIQYVEGKLMKFPLGIAHFLEHKLFEDDEKNIISLFSSLGASVNAYINYDMTAYFFSCASKELSEPLNLLLDFTQKLVINEESVLKEKEIIKQEILMTNLSTDRLLMSETLKAVFNNLPLRNDIAGTIKSINQISVKDLVKVYEINYHPSNMIMVISSPVKPQIIIDIIKKNQNSKTFKPFVKALNFEYQEKLKVKNNRKIIKMDINSTKSTLTFKFAPLKCSSFERKKYEISLKFLLMSVFSTLNKKYQIWIDKKIISNYFDYDIEISDDCFLLIFSDDNKHPIKFKNFVIKQLKNICKQKISLKMLKQLQKRYFGLTLATLDDGFDICNDIARLYFDNLDLFEILELYLKISLDDLSNIVEKLDFNNYSLVTISKK